MVWNVQIYSELLCGVKQQWCHPYLCVRGNKENKTNKQTYDLSAQIICRYVCFCNALWKCSLSIYIYNLFTIFFFTLFPQCRSCPSSQQHGCFHCSASLATVSFLLWILCRDSRPVFLEQKMDLVTLPCRLRDIDRPERQDDHEEKPASDSAVNYGS